MGGPPRPMIQVKSWTGSVRCASCGSSRWQPCVHQPGRERDRAQTEVTVVHHDLAPAGQHCVGRALHDTARRPREGVPCRRGQLGHRALHRLSGPLHVPHQVGGGPPRPRLDVRVPLLDAPRVLVAELAGRRTLEAPHDAVGVASQMGQQVTDAPAGQEAGASRRGVAQTIERRTKRRVGGRAPRDPPGGPPAVRPDHLAGMEDCPSSMSAMTARMNSFASSVMPPATPP